MDTIDKKILWVLIILIILGIGISLYMYFLRSSLESADREINNQPKVTNFAECVKAGNPVLESYPRQCQHGEQIFTEDSQPIVGGDKDEHGCIGSAGYLWCEPKEKCLRIWEEECYVSVEQEIQYFLANKYNKPASEVNIYINKQTANHVSGSIRFSPESSAGGMFLAMRSGNIWEIVYDGNGSIDCEKMRLEYNFPDEILKPNFCD